MYKIYKITNLSDGRVYIGSTKQKINERFNGHKYKAKKGISRCCLKDFDFENCKYECLEELNTDNYDEIRWRERYHIENNECVNSDRPIITKKERQERQKQNATKRGIFEKYTCECGSTIQKIEKNRHERTKRHQKYINK